MTCLCVGGFFCVFVCFVFVPMLFSSNNSDIELDVVMCFTLFSLALGFFGSHYSDPK